MGYCKDASTFDVPQNTLKSKIAEILGKAFIRAATVSNAINCFKVRGICPFDPSIFPDSAFHASNATDYAQNKESDAAYNVCTPNDHPLCISTAADTNTSPANDEPRCSHHHVSSRQDDSSLNVSVNIEVAIDGPTAPVLERKMNMMRCILFVNILILPYVLMLRKSQPLMRQHDLRVYSKYAGSWKHVFVLTLAADKEGCLFMTQSSSLSHIRHVRAVPRETPACQVAQD
ncbi:hypothetical protein PR048_019120 [Dryococelus australis]|uniref:Uncharacterized protein n=1 Tax=Dryococelus australis TaxID=614101 RepID=A0ABQ9H2Q0_9NEOP|nr:hypothetical protein PR048_019120 [Dryococelus australis]